MPHSSIDLLFVHETSNSTVLIVCTSVCLLRTHLCMKMMQLIHAEGGVAAAVCVHAVMATMNLMTHSVTLSSTVNVATHQQISWHKSNSPPHNISGQFSHVQSILPHHHASSQLWAMQVFSYGTEAVWMAGQSICLHQLLVNQLLQFVC